MKRYTFIKAYEAKEGTIPQGSEITVMDNGAVYFNGGLVHTAYQEMLKSMVDDKAMKNQYLRETPILYNKV